MRRNVVTTLIALLVAAGVLLLGARWLEKAMLYHPIAALDGNPASAGMPFEDVTFTSSDGETLHGWWIPASVSPEQEDRAPALLFFHGNAGNRSHRLHNLAGLHRAGIAVFIFDYRGYGGSTGTPGEEGLLQDGEAAFDWLRNKVGPRPIVMFGRSLGGGVAARVALTRPPVGLILESTLTNVPDMAVRVLPLPGVRRLVRSRLDALAAVRVLTVPLLVIHGEEDEIIPFAMGQTLFHEAASPRKAFHPVPGGRHNDTYLGAGDDYYRWIVDFLEELKPPAQ